MLRASLVRPSVPSPRPASRSWSFATPPRALAAVLCVVSSCASNQPHVVDAPPQGASLPDSLQSTEDPRSPWEAPPLEIAVSVRDGRTGQRLSFAQLLDRLAEVDAVFLGETHDDETTHRVEHAVYEGVVERRDGRVVLAMEMFERDVQAVLDEYLSGAIDEATFLERSRPWGNYRVAYRPMVELAREQGLDVVASNFPRPLRSRMAMEGLSVDQLPENQRALAPAEIQPNTPQYWRRTDNAIRGHLDMMRAMESGDEQRLNSTQTLWDNSMGDSVARILTERSDHSVVHVNGGFHSAFWDGTVHQLRLRKPDATVATVAIRPVNRPHAARLWGAAEADFVVFAETRGRDARDGAYAVTVPRAAEYEIHLPKSASEQSPVPLLLWLGDDGRSADDGLALWRERLGDEVAIACFQPTYRERAADLGEGGRWFWADRFSEDIGISRSIVQEAWGYLLRRLPIDPTRVVLAGEGTGATVIAATTLFTESMDLTTLAFEPRHYSRLKDFPLPLPELRGDAPVRNKSLRVIAPDGDRAWWSDELEEYREVEFDAEFELLDTDPWLSDWAQEDRLREALGLPRQPPPRGLARRHLVCPTDSPRAWQWCRELAIETAAEHGELVAVLRDESEATASQPYSLTVHAETMLGEGVVPRCPGPFGGTTVLVVADDTELEPWFALEENDPLQRHSRFHRTRIATRTGEHGIAVVLPRLQAENRTNILLVPAEFCVDAGTMRELERLAAPFANDLTLHWQPGLGGALTLADE